MGKLIDIAGGVLTYDSDTGAIVHRYGAYFEDSTVKELFESEEIKSATSLSLTPIYSDRGYMSSAITESEFLKLIEAIKNHKDGQLEGLHLRRFKFDDAKIIQLLGAIIENTQLASQMKELSLLDGNIGKKTLDFVKDELIPASPKLVEINIKGQGPGSVGAGRGPSPDPKENIETLHSDSLDEIQKLLAARNVQAVSVDDGQVVTPANTEVSLFGGGSGFIKNAAGDEPRDTTVKYCGFKSGFLN